MVVFLPPRGGWEGRAGPLWRRENKSQVCSYARVALKLRTLKLLVLLVLLGRRDGEERSQAGVGGGVERSVFFFLVLSSWQQLVCVNIR